MDHRAWIRVMRSSDRWMSAAGAVQSEHVHWKPQWKSREDWRFACVWKGLLGMILVSQAVLFFPSHGVWEVVITENFETLMIRTRGM